jgi:hypothetical protein
MTTHDSPSWIMALAGAAAVGVDRNQIELSTFNFQLPARHSLTNKQTNKHKQIKFASVL